MRPINSEKNITLPPVTASSISERYQILLNRPSLASWKSVIAVIKCFRRFHEEMASCDVFGLLFRPIVLVFRLSGLWPNGSRSIIYFAYGAIFFIIFSLGLTTVEIIQLTKSVENGKLTETMFMTLTDLAVLLKFVNFHWRWRSMQELYEISRDFQLETVAEAKLFNERMRFNYRIVLLLFFSVNTAHAGAELKTIFTPSLLLPFPAWYPSSWLDGGIQYWLTYAHNSISHFIGSNLVSALDGFQTSLLYIASVQMEILGFRLKSLGHHEVQPRSGYRKNKMEKPRHLECIIKCIRTHQQILELSIFQFSSTNFFPMKNNNSAGSRRKSKGIFRCLCWSRFVSVVRYRVVSSEKWRLWVCYFQQCIGDSFLILHVSTSRKTIWRFNWIAEQCCSH